MGNAALATPPTGTNGSAAAGQPPAFDNVIKGAERIEGLMPFWKRQDKLWLELPAQQLNKPFFLSPQLVTGIGEQGLFGGLLASRWAEVGRPQWVEFRRVNQQIQLLAINGTYSAAPDSATAQAVSVAFSPSLLASAPLASSEHPQRGSILVDWSSMMGVDMMGLGIQLQRAYRQSYAADARNTVVTQQPSDGQALVWQVQHHFQTSNLGGGASTAEGGSRLPTGLPDPRSLFLSVRYVLTPLPEKLMPVRPADQRVGYFATTRLDFTNDLARNPRVRFINRWSLAPADSTATPSIPQRPLTFWLDASIPTEYRAAITEGVLEWNKAFDAIGFRQVIHVRDDPKQQPTNTVGNGQVVIRWLTNHEPRFGAIGPSHVDPRTGEILAASIAFESLSSRSIRTLRRQNLADQEQQAAQWPDACTHALDASEQLELAVAAMTDEQGQVLPPDHEKVKAFVQAYLKDTTMHEVGHVLGLRHNFKASRWHTMSELAQPELTSQQGNSASVMDYSAINLGMPGQPWGMPFQTTLGPYDYWAIEYGYKPLAGSQAEQAAALRLIADRQSLPQWQQPLDYGTDEDLNIGLDPQTMTFDLGSDPIGFATHRWQLGERLMARQSAVLALQRKQLSMDDVALLRRRVLYAMRDMARASQLAARQVGGLITRRDAPDSGRPSLEPLGSHEQRRALSWLSEHVLSPSRMQLPAPLLRQLGPDFLERGEASSEADAGNATDFSPAEQWTGIYQSVLDALMSEKLAQRLQDNADKVRDTDPKPLNWAEVQATLYQRIWGKRPDIAGMDSTTRAWLRSLQRAHVQRLAAALVKNAPRTDMRATLRAQASSLQRQIQRVLKTHRLPTEERVHLEDCDATLSRALEAFVLRPSP